MHPYGVRDVEKLLGLTRNTIRALISAEFVTPARGPRNSWLFSFQDLILLRTAQALVAAKVPQRRITRSLKELRRHLPDSMPLTGLAIGAVADRVVVREGAGRWQADSGQYLLAFEGDPADGSLSVIERVDLPPADAQGWFERGLALEATDTEGAIDAYERAIEEDAARLDARINLGLLLHDAGRHAEAEHAYRDAIRHCGRAPVIFFNLGVLLEDMNRRREAIDAYQSAITADPDLADGHYNLALLFQRLGKPKDAIRHMARYRQLAGGAR